MVDVVICCWTRLEVDCGRDRPRDLSPPSPLLILSRCPLAVDATRDVTIQLCLFTSDGEEIGGELMELMGSSTLVEQGEGKACRE